MSQKTKPESPAAQLDKVQAHVRKTFTERDRDRERVDVYDSEYWFCVVFQTREQAQEALAKLGFEDVKYILGEELMASIGETLSAQGLTWPKTRSTLSRDTIEKSTEPYGS